MTQFFPRAPAGGWGMMVKFSAPVFIFYAMTRNLADTQLKLFYF